MLRTFTPLVLTVAALLVAPGMAVVAEDSVVARSGQATLSETAVREMIERADARTRAQLSEDPALLSQFVRSRLARLAILAEAKAKKWEQSPDVVRQIEQARTDVIVDSFIASSAKPAADYPSDREIEAAYEANKSKFLRPRRYRLAQIFFALPAGAGAEDQQKAEKRAREVLQQARSGKADFAELARRHSDEKMTATKGGELDWVSEDRLVVAIREAVAGLEKGGVSEPIRAADGWHLIKLLETEPAATAPLSAVRSQLVDALRQQRASENANPFVADFLRKHPVQIDEIKLSKLIEK